MQVTNQSPSKGRLSAGAAFFLLIYRHISTHICLSALRHRLYADMTARRSKVLFFRRGSSAFRTFVPGGIVLVLVSRRSRSNRHFPPLPSLTRQYSMCRRAYNSRQSPTPCLCQTVEYIAVHRSDFPKNAPAPPTLQCPTTFSEIPGVACRTERKNIHRLSWLQPQRVILPLALEHTALNFLHRRVRSRGRAHRRGVLAIFPA